MKVVHVRSCVGKVLLEVDDLFEFIAQFNQLPVPVTNLIDGLGLLLTRGLILVLFFEQHADRVEKIRTHLSLDELSRLRMPLHHGLDGGRRVLWVKRLINIGLWPIGVLHLGLVLLERVSELILLEVS